MVKLNVLYEGDLRTVVSHEPSGKKLYTDAPVDNMGKGENFSPTDLLAASLASCIATVLGIYAAKKKIDLKGMRLEIEKKMSESGSRRIAKLDTKIWIPIKISEEEKDKFKSIAETCPVYHSLSPEISHKIDFYWL